MRSRYFAGANGAQFSYAVEASYTCPLAPESEPKLLSAAAAAVLECDAEKLAKLLERAHGSRQGRERDELGKLTDRCRVCGHRLERVGFAAWADEPELDQTRERIAARLGFGGPMRRLKPRRYFDRKKDAIEWAREEAKIHRSAAAELEAGGK